MTGGPVFPHEDTQYPETPLVLVYCPGTPEGEPCGQVAEVYNAAQVNAAGIDGWSPITMVRVRCVNLHLYCGPLDRLTEALIYTDIPGVEDCPEHL